jgi:hypothetical protein
MRTPIGNEPMTDRDSFDEDDRPLFVYCQLYIYGVKIEI